MTEVNVSKAKALLSQLLDQALAGEGVIIMRSERRLVRLMPFENAPTKQVLGTAKGDFTLPEDFDAPLPEHVLAEFER